MKHLVYYADAELDLLGIAEEIAADNPARALSYIAELEAKALQAAERPKRFAFARRSARLSDQRRTGLT